MIKLEINKDFDEEKNIEQILRESANSVIRLFGLTYKESDFWFTSKMNFISMYKGKDTGNAEKIAYIQQNFDRLDITIAENRSDLDLFDLDITK